MIVLIFFCNNRISGHSIRQKEDGIVGRGIAVYGNHIVGILDILTEGLLQKLSGNSQIRCHKSKHGTHIGMNHAGALAHTAYGYGFSACLKLHSHFLFLRIRRHNRLRRLSSAFLGIGQQRRHHPDSGRQTIHGKLHTNHSCGSH